MQLYLFNRSTKVSLSDVNAMVLAVNMLLVQFCNAWNITASTITYKTGNPTTGMKYIFYLVDQDPSAPGALAYHTETTGGLYVGYVLCQTILTYGGVTLYKDNKTPTIASALFHEIAEALIDPTVNIWWVVNNRQCVAAEVCDPVQNNIVLQQVIVSGRVINVGLSDFVYPAWLDPYASVGSRFNYLNTLKRPFTMSAGGYLIVLTINSGTISYVFGKKVPNWQQEAKLANTKRVSVGSRDIHDVREKVDTIEEVDDLVE